ncbi:bifunctional allantoicase/(S)-ureidoglycine aminohydrolase [Arthrobacter bambusae]
MAGSFHPEVAIPQAQLPKDRAMVKDAYTVIPKGVLIDTVTSNLPGWENTRAWIIARPIEGFATRFSQLIVEVGPGGGSRKPEPEAAVEGVLFLTRGWLTLALDGELHILEEGSYAYIAAGAAWSVRNDSDGITNFHWIRKAYEPADGYTATSFVTRDQDVQPSQMQGTNGSWATTRFVDPDDLAHDMHVNIVTFEPGTSIPFPGTPAMEHGLFVLEGNGVYLLNDDWVKVEAGDFMWLRAFCPQVCYAGGPGKFCYLLYTDANRQIRLT